MAFLIDHKASISSWPVQSIRHPRNPSLGASLAQRARPAPLSVGEAECDVPTPSNTPSRLAGDEPRLAVPDVYRIESTAPFSLEVGSQSPQCSSLATSPTSSPGLAAPERKRMYLESSAPFRCESRNRSGLPSRSRSPRMQPTNLRRPYPVRDDRALGGVRLAPAHAATLCLPRPPLRSHNRSYAALDRRVALVLSVLALASTNHALKVPVRGASKVGSPQRLEKRLDLCSPPIEERGADQTKVTGLTPSCKPAQ